MRIVCGQLTLHAGLLAVRRAIKEIPDMPVLSHVLLQAKGGRACLTANNLEIAIMREMGAEILEEGAVVVPWQRLEDLARRLPPVPGGEDGDQPIEMGVVPDASTLSVRGGRSRATIFGMHPSEFSGVPGSEQIAEGESVSFSLDVALFASMVKKVAFAAATDEKWISQRDLPVLKGLLVRVSGQSLTMTARDGYRLATCEAHLQKACGRECTVVIPAWTATEFARLLEASRPAVAVRVGLSEKRAQVSCSIPGLTLLSRLLPWDYPNPLGFRTCLERGCHLGVVVETHKLASALKAAAQVARADGDLVTLRFERGAGDGRGHVFLRAQSEDLGEQAEVIDVVDLQGAGDGCQLLLKVSQLSGIVAAIRTPHLILEVRAPEEPVVLRPIGDESGTNSVYMLVPCFRRT